MKQTLCWSCSNPYPVNEPVCPKCRSINANCDFMAAAQQSMSPVQTKTYSDGTTATGPTPLPERSPTEKEEAEVLALAEDYGQWMWDAGYMDDPRGESLVDNAKIKRDEIEKALNSALLLAYAEGRKDEREQWESVARLALAALNTCDGCDSDKGYSQWFVQEQVDNAIKALCALICPVCLGAGWVAERPGEQCACGLYSWEARK